MRRSSRGGKGSKLTFTPYVAEAVVLALKKYLLVNSSVEGDKIIRKNFVNLGLAVASDNGLIVPVIKHAEELNFLGLARAVYDLAARTREKRLKPDDIQGGTFTISNVGVFGTLIGTPIISQPQVAILGTGAITKRVAVINDAIAIRSMAFFTLSLSPHHRRRAGGDVPERDHPAPGGIRPGTEALTMEIVIRALESSPLDRPSQVSNPA